jgi:hypothetical protein
MSLHLKAVHLFDLGDSSDVFRRFVFPNESQQSREAQSHSGAAAVQSGSMNG